MNVAEMNRIGKTKIYNKNDVILDENCIDRCIFIVLKGAARIKESLNGIVNELPAGSIMGGIPVLQDHIILYTVTATEDNTVIFEITSSTYDSLIPKSPELFYRIFMNLLNKVRDGIDILTETDSVTATLYKLEPTYERVNLMKDSDIVRLVKEDLNYTVFMMRYLFDLSIKLGLKNIF